jgi:tetratricopeptide (TPR) repeat protein
MKKFVPAILILTTSSIAFAQAHRETAAREAASKAPRDASASLALARVLRRAGSYDPALKELQRGAALASARNPEMTARFRRETTLVQLDQGSYDAALASCKQLTGAMAHVCLAEGQMLHKRATEAMPEVTKALAIDPNLYEAKVAEGYVRWQDGGLAEALAAFNAATASNPSRPEAFLGLGRFQLANARPPQALEAFEKAVAADGDDPDALLALGTSLGMTERASTVLRQAVTARPNNGAARARIAEVLLALGRLYEADQEARAALQCAGIQSDWHTILGEVQLRRAQPDDALKSAEAALKLISNSARAKLLLADAHAAKHDIDLAIEAWQASFNLASTNPAPLVHAALGCLANQRETTAKAFSDRVTHGFPNHAPGWDAAGDVAIRAGDKAAAKAAWTKALACSDGVIDKDAVRRKIAAAK